MCCISYKYQFFFFTKSSGHWHKGRGQITRNTDVLLLFFALCIMQNTQIKQCQIPCHKSLRRDAKRCCLFSKDHIKRPSICIVVFMVVVHWRHFCSDCKLNVETKSKMRQLRWSRLGEAQNKPICMWCGNSITIHLP